MRSLSNVCTRPGPGVRRERGTVLLMVVGVLALIAIIAILYGAIGQADRRASAAYVRAVALDDQAGKIGEYISGIIGRSTFDTVRETGYGTWVATQFPQGRPMHVLEDYPSVDPNRLSRPPAGTPPAQLEARRFRPFGNGYRAWLAPTDPTRVGKTPTADGSGTRPYLDHRDWDSITNVAPDGRFVNLSNLRNNFNAEPGVGLDASGRPRMSEGLTLFGSNGRPYNPNTEPVLLDDGTTADPNIPWHWTRRQTWAYRPTRELGSSGTLPDPGEPAYYPNQWADADGDGMGDSRWIELVDSTIPGQVQTILPLNRARIFVAARVVDLSARINVNTAANLEMLLPLDHAPDFLPTPDASYPAGSTPADIDVRRLLQMSDVYAAYLRFPVGTDQPVGYDGFDQPRVTIPPGPQPSHYGAYQSPVVAEAVGTGAYAALRIAIARGSVPQPTSPPFSLSRPLDRYAHYDAFAYDPTGARRYSTGTPRAGTLSPLGLGDAAELLTFDRVNDPERTSTLEDITGGRLAAYPGLDPLRSNRSLMVERGGRSNRFSPSTGFADPDALLSASADRRHALTTINGDRPLTSVVSPVEAAAIGQRPNELNPSEVRVDARALLQYGAGNMTTPPIADINKYFGYLADCLMPYRDSLVGTSPSWDTSATSPPTLTLCYGWRGMELAYRLTAHLAANTISAAHPATTAASEPLALSLLVHTPTPPPSVTDYPFPLLQLPSLPNDNELWESGTPLTSSANVNIFGIDAQPFIVEAASYTFYTDTPRDISGGDNEFARGPNAQITIDGTIDESIPDDNPDFLAEILAFQITNPFDHDVILTRADGKVLYYIEYAGRYFQLGRLSDTVEPTAFTLPEEVRLLAGQTRVFYATSPRTTAAVNARFMRSNSTTMGGVVPHPDVPADFLQRWANARFGPNSVHIPMCNPITGVLIAPAAPVAPRGGLLDLFGRNTTITPERQKVVYLWRVMRAAPADGDTSQPNDLKNDFLADRLHEPGSGGNSVLRQRISTGNLEVPGSDAGDDSLTPSPTGGSNPARDNTGFTITLWGAVRRPTKSPPTQMPPRGAMPPWCIEAKLDQSYGGTPYNKAQEGPTADRGNAGEYGRTGVSRYRTIHAMWVDQTTAGSQATNPQMAHEPRDKSGNDIPNSRFQTAPNTFATFNQQAIEIHLGDPSIPAQPAQPSGLFRRTGDLLFPLAIGPWHDPALPPISGMPAGYVSEQEGRRTCLSEVLALAMDYYSPPATTPAGAPEMFFQLGHRVAGAAISDPPTIRPVLDRGNLVLDDFVPFIDVGDAAGGPPNGQFDLGVDHTLGLGIPLALNILDKFRMNDYGSLTQNVPGRLNINLAPVFNMQVLPLLTPDPVGFTTDPTTTYPNVGLFQPTTQTQDGATLLAAYRDKARLRTRRLLGALTPGQIMDFTDENNTVTPVVRGREFATGIPGLHEDPGFRSIGEVLATSIRRIQMDRYPTGEPPPDPTFDNLDRYGHDDHSINQHGVDVPLYTNGAIQEDDQIADEYDEKLAVANAIINTISVRSDVFCVWFVVHGYLPADVEVGADGANPMVPSIARRYMMVVDRSNVVKASDKPRVLLMQEVPM